MSLSRALKAITVAGTSSDSAAASAPAAEIGAMHHPSVDWR